MSERHVLDNWKEIAAYLGRTGKTCRNWEKEYGLPVHRLDGSSRAHVFAYTDEVDRWKEKMLHEKPTGVRRLLVPALALLVLAAGGAAIWRFLLRRAEPALANMDNSIALISFENQTGDKALDDYRKMIPSRLITSLEQTQSFYVMSTERQRDLLKQVGKGGAEFIDSDAGFEVCRKDGVRSLIIGSFYRSGDTFYTDVKVLDVKTKRLLRTAKAQGQGPESLFIGQVDDLSRQIAEQIAAGAGITKEKIDASLRPIGDVSTRSAEAYKYYLRGIEYLHVNFDVYKARECLQKAVEIDPEFAMAYGLLGDANVMGAAPNYPAGIQAYEKARSLSQKVTEKERLQIEWLYAFVVKRNNDKAYAIAKEQVAKYPKDKGGHIRLAWLYKNWLSDPDKAREELNAALSLDPNFSIPLNRLGHIYLERKEFTKALEYFQRQVIASPENPNALESLAEGYFRAGKVAEAKATMLKMLETFPYTYMQDFLGYITALEEDYGETLRWEERRLEVCKPQEKPSVYEQRGFFRGWLGDLDGSLSDIQRAEDMAKDMGNKGAVAAYKELRAWIYLDQHELDMSRKSREDFHAYTLKELPQFTSVYDSFYNEALGYIECAEGKADRAELRWKEMEALIPKVPAGIQELLKYRAGLLRAEVGLAQGRIDEVIGFLTKAPPRPPAFIQDKEIAVSDIDTIKYNLPFHKDVLARAYARKGEPDKAIAEYERLTTFDPKNEAQFLIHPKYHYRLGLLYEQKGQMAKAAERYRKFLGLWKDAEPGLPEVVDAKKRFAVLENRLNVF